MDRQVVDWLKTMVGFPHSASGTLVSGGSMANIVGRQVELAGRRVEDFASDGFIRQQLELLFLCDVPGDYVARNGHSPDKHQDAVVWIAQDSLMDINLMPSDLCSILSSADLASHPVYLGEIKP